MWVSAGMCTHQASSPPWPIGDLGASTPWRPHLRSQHFLGIWIYGATLEGGIFTGKLEPRTFSRADFSKTWNFGGISPLRKYCRCGWRRGAGFWNEWGKNARVGDWCSWVTALLTGSCPCPQQHFLSLYIWLGLPLGSFSISKLFHSHTQHRGCHPHPNNSSNLSLQIHGYCIVLSLGAENQKVLAELSPRCFMELV